MRITVASSANILSLRVSAIPTGSPVRRIACPSSRCRILYSRLFQDSCAIRRSWPTRRYRIRMSRHLSCAKPAPHELHTFPGDIERSYWLTGHGDLLRLLHNTIRWITRDERIVHVAGEGFVEMFAWETGPGYAVHLLNYTNPNAHHGWMQSTYPLGPQTVSMKMPQGVRVKSVELLRAERRVTFDLESQVLKFTIPRVADYEVAAITVA